MFSTIGRSESNVSRFICTSFGKEMEEDFGVDNETKLKAYTWCQEYLGGVWKQIDLEEFHIRDLSLDKSNNKHYICSLLPHRLPVYGEPTATLLRVFKRPILAGKREKCTNEPNEVLLRVYGEIFYEGEAPLLDTVIFSLLSERRQAPKLYGVFSEGRLEEYIPSRALRTDELSDPELSRIIAGKLAGFHQLQLPLCKEPRWLEQMLDKWFNRIKSITFEDDVNQQFMKQILAFDLEAERKFIKRLVSQTKSPVVFCHNDCQEGNILLASGENAAEKNLVLIDYEYSSYNFREFDLANHFVEWSMNYCIKEPPYYTLKPEDFPSRGQQLTFIRAYLAASRQLGVCQPGCHGDSSEEEEAILKEVKRFCPVSHFFWALWSIIQAKISQTTFGYMEYAVARFKEYFRHKALIPLDMLPSSADQRSAEAEGNASVHPLDQRQAIVT